MAFQRPKDLIEEQVSEIQSEILKRSAHIKQRNFEEIHAQDLDLLFVAYDQTFFDGLCRQALNGRSIGFRLSRRMTRSGGTTTRYKARNGEVSYEIAVASSMLFDGFGEIDRTITVCGLKCDNRLQALQRIFEHEMIHLTEHLCWENSNCSAVRFQDIARRFFLHRAHTHNLVTRRERAAQSGIRIGSRVIFEFEGRRLLGRVNRITKRATVLVQDAEGVRFTDGKRYRTYYVPIQMLRLVPKPEQLMLGLRDDRVPRVL
jgi:hypothetical protein